MTSLNSHQLTESDKTQYKAHVLIVEDQSVEQLRLASMLEKLGFSTSCANNGQHALEIIDAESIDIIISDWKMPVMDGLSLCRNIRNRPGNDYPYFILLTGCDTRPDLIAGMDAGADDFITKPFNGEELRVRLEAGYRIELLKKQLNNKSEHIERTNKILKLAQQEMKSDLETASRMQMELLPTNYRIFEQWNADAIYRPASGVSGDMFNLFRINDSLLGFYHVDVSGHGIAAAMMSFTLSRLLGATPGSIDEKLTTLSFSELSSADIVNQLNQRFQNDQLHIPFFTMIYGVIETLTGQVKLCQAGHPYPLLISKSGHVNRIGQSGFPVGCIEDAQYEDTLFTLQQGERLIVYSDGVTECRDSNNKQFSDIRLIGMLGNTHNKPIRNIMQMLDDTLQRWSSGAQQEDDITALLIEHDACTGCVYD